MKLLPSARLRNQKGFSLIELMVVVAIIGILAAIAVPNVLKFMAKARQSEVKTLLSGIYTAEKAFYAEYSAYHSMFQAIGYSPEGQLRYNAGFSGSTADAGAANGYNGVPGTIRDTLTYCGTAATRANGCQILNGVDGASPPGLPTATVVVNGFTAGGIAKIYAPLGGTAASDTWTIDGDKVLSNTVPGIK